MIGDSWDLHETVLITLSKLYIVTLLYREMLNERIILNFENIQVFIAPSSDILNTLLKMLFLNVKVKTVIYFSMSIIKYAYNVLNIQCRSIVLSVALTQNVYFPFFSQ